MKNLIAFSKTFGYVQYFHPSDEAKLGIWDNVAINGSKIMMDVKNDQELLQNLKAIFLPLAPSLQFSDNGSTIKFDEQKMSPLDRKDLLPVYWQHLGFNLYSGIMERPYYSIRVNRSSPFEQRNQYTANITGKYDVRRYRGLPFEFRIRAEVNDSTFTLPLSMGISGTQSSSKNLILDKTSGKDYVFNGMVGDSVNHLIFKLNSNLGIPASLNKPELIVIENGLKVKPMEIDDDGKTLGTQQITLEVNSTDLPLFNKELNFGEYIKTELVKGIHFLMPLVVLGNQSKTFPVAIQSNDFQSGSIAKTLNKDYYGKTAFSFTEVRLADVIILWNIFKHSYPYWGDVKISAEAILEKALADAARPQSPEGFIQTIKKMTGYYNDAHMFVVTKDINDSLYSPAISLVKVRKKVVVKDVLNKTTSAFLSPGDIVKEINDKSIKTILDSLMNYNSGSRQMKTLLALNNALTQNMPKNISMKIERGNVIKKIDLKSDEPAKFLVPGNSGYLKRSNGWLNPQVYYFDLTRNSLNAKDLRELTTARNIIFDLRGYPFDQTVSENLIEALITKKLQVSRMFIPEILYPDYRNVSYLPVKEEYNPSIANHLKGNIMFLADASAQSAAESILGLVKDCHLGTIIGTPTSGTNGDVNIAYLPGKVTVYFTGMLVKTTDGKKHHLKGIKPDVYCEQSIESIKLRQDLVLQKAISLSR
ncbi:S41 family peptidase [Pedobacter sp. 22163]|uniref:S41 family peptidase n=1 Tax=Pedobacter sp. 22163 TaxID=3453883 RepID=UPI003F85F45E